MAVGLIRRGDILLIEFGPPAAQRPTLPGLPS